MNGPAKGYYDGLISASPFGNEQRRRSSMSEDPANQPFDEVQKAQHYNSHPSGVETVDVNEWFTGNVAAAIKYVWRKNHKEPVPLRDLRKAVWYLEREQKRLGEAGYGAAIVLPMSREMRDRLNDRIVRVCQADLGGLLSGVLAALMMADGLYALGLEPALQLVRVAVSAAEREQGKWATKQKFSRTR